MEEITREETDNFINENRCIFKKYKPIKKIGRGSFGNIYRVVRLNDNAEFAMKVEKVDAKQKTLEREAYYLFTLQGGFGIPKLITFGRTKHYNILVETLLNKSLFDLFINKSNKFRLTDCCLIGIQILEILEWIHSKDIIYRDVKPENFLIGIKDPNAIYVVDFGLCKKYRSSKTGKHLLPKLTGKFSGTLIYASSNVLKGKESSRRDDLISLGYMLIYLLKRDIPWNSTFKDLNKEKYYNLIYLKDTNSNGELFKGLPDELVEYIKYTRSLKFEQDPDYTYLRSLFRKILLRSDFENNYMTFSWIDPKDKNLLGIPKNNSKRKQTPQNRILKNLKENRKNLSVKTLSLQTTKNNLNQNSELTIDSSINKNAQVKSDVNIKNILTEEGKNKILNLKKNDKNLKIKFHPYIPLKINHDRIKSGQINSLRQQQSAKYLPLKYNKNDIKKNNVKSSKRFHNPKSRSIYIKNDPLSQTNSIFGSKNINKFFVLKKKNDNINIYNNYRTFSTIDNKNNLINRCEIGAKKILLNKKLKNMKNMNMKHMNIKNMKNQIININNIGLSNNYNIMHTLSNYNIHRKNQKSLFLCHKKNALSLTENNDNLIYSKDTNYVSPLRNKKINILNKNIINKGKSEVVDSSRICLILYNNFMNK